MRLLMDKKNNGLQVAICMAHSAVMTSICEEEEEGRSLKCSQSIHALSTVHCTAPLETL